MILINDVECRTQKQAVLEYLKTGKTITQAEATELCGTQRLGAIIYNLRHKSGFDIYKIDCKGTNRFGHNTNYCKYILSNTREEIAKIEKGE
tara:strand:+ start:349 stop:624 length:276 start_codon:yes stop_codon:yes gene_type:complete